VWKRFYKLPLYLKFLVLLLPILVVSTSALSLFFYLHLKDRVYYSSWQRLELFSLELDWVGQFVKHHLRPALFELIHDRKLILSEETLQFISTTRVRKALFFEVQKKYSDLIFERMSPYPLNPENQLKEYAKDLYRQFLENRSRKEWRGEMIIGGRKYLVLAKPVYAEQGCMSCHHQAGSEFKKIREYYRNSQGYAWGPNDLMGIEVYRLDLKKALEELNSAVVTFFIVGLVFLIILLLLLETLFFTLVAKPLQRLSNHFKEIRQGEKPLRPFEAEERDDEIGRLVKEFNALAIHLEKVQRELEKSLAILQTVVDSITDPLALISKDCEIILENNAFKNWKERECAKELIEEVLEEKKAKTRYYEGKGGKIYNIHVYPVFEKGNAVEKAIILVEDITERKKMEERMFLLEKYASLGQIAAGIAHELNNPLSGMLLIVKELQKDNLSTDEKLQYLSLLYEGMLRIQSILRELLQFSRAEEVKAETIDLVDVLEKSLGLIAHLISKNGIELKKDYEDDRIWVKGDAKKLGQVFLNLILNAIQAMEAEAQKSLTIKVEVEREHAVVAISDTGPGIPEELKLKVFEPFFTTKPPGQGTGLGLTVALAIIQKHQGDLWFETSSSGTTFYVKLPLAKKHKNEA
jgi:signal transduction histidine kinase